MRAVLAIGSNVGDRQNYLSLAIANLSTLLEDIKPSPIYESHALLPENAPDSWNMPFLNMAIRGNSNLSPLALLNAIKEIEMIMGRKSEKMRWAPRVIDIDILVYDDVVLDEELLHIPHLEILNRLFMLQPLADVYPEWKFPRKGKYYGITAKALAEKLAASAQEQNLIQLYAKHL